MYKSLSVIDTDLAGSRSSVALDSARKDGSKWEVLSDKGKLVMEHQPFLYMIFPYVPTFKSLFVGGFSSKTRSITRGYSKFRPFGPLVI